MRAVVVDRWMEPRELRVSEVPEPPLRSGSMRVEVRAAGCNFFDLLMVRGSYQVKPPFPFVPGGELAGVVREVGDGVTRFAAGDHVFAAPGIGGFAEVAVVPASDAHALPQDLSFAEGAALPIVYPTAYTALEALGSRRTFEKLVVAP